MAGWYLNVLCYEAPYGHASSGIRTQDLEMQSQERYRTATRTLHLIRDFAIRTKKLVAMKNP